MATIAELLLEQGRQAADARRQQGAQSAQLWSGLGNTLASALTSYAQQKQEQPFIDAQRKIAIANAGKVDEDAQLKALFHADKPPTPAQIISVVGPERGTSIVKGLAALAGDPKQGYDDTQKVLRDTLQGMNALPEGLRSEYYPSVRTHLIQKGVIKPEDAPEQYDANWWQSTAHYGDKPADPLKPVPVDGVDANGKPVTKFVTPTAGTVVPKAAPPPKMQRIVVKGPGGKPVVKMVPESDLMNGGVEQYERPPQNGGTGEGTSENTLTPDAVDYVGTQYRILGPSGIPTRLDESEKKRIINAATAQAKALGQSPAVAVQRQAAYKADASSLTQMRKMSSSAESYENKALSQADLVSDLSQKVNRTQFPAINAALLTGKAAFGDSDTQQLYNAITTFTNEYAKIMEGATGSAAASSDSARKAAERLIAAKMNKGTVQDVLDLMKKEMRYTINGYGATIDHITERMGGTPIEPTAKDDTGWTDVGNGVRIRVKP